MAANPDSLKLMQAIDFVNGSNPMQGIQMLREIVASDSMNLDAQFYLGLFSVKSGQLDKAADRFRKVIAIDSTYAQAYTELGAVLLQSDSVDAALAQFSHCLVFAPDNLDALFFSARILEGKEKWEEARKNYARVLELNTDSIVNVRVQELIERIDQKIKP